MLPLLLMLLLLLSQAELQEVRLCPAPQRLWTPANTCRREHRAAGEYAHAADDSFAASIHP